MDYYIDPTELLPSRQPRAVLSSSATLRILEQVLNPSPSTLSCLRSCIFVSLDLGTGPVKGTPSKLMSVGVSLLDTDVLATLDTSDEAAIGRAMPSHLYNLTGKPIPCISGIPQYLFGTPEQLDHNEVRETLIKILSPVNQKGHPRNVVLIGHNVIYDMRMMNEYLGINLNDIPNVSAVVDSDRLVCELCNLRLTNFRISLGQTLILLGIRYMYLHDSSNDAHFTLRALILLFCRWKSEKDFHDYNQEEEEKSRWEESLQVLTAIGRFWGGTIPQVRPSGKRGRRVKPEKPKYRGDVWEEQMSNESLLEFLTDGSEVLQD